jgi:Leucine-rich repeat (LRR) protein
MKIICEFKIVNWSHIDPNHTKIYTAIVEDKDLTKDSTVDLTGDHLPGYSTNLVAGLQFANCQMNEIPQNINLNPKNISFMTIIKCGLKEVKNEDFCQFSNLLYVNLSHNDLRYLPGDLFKGSKDLQHIVITNNKIKTIKPSIVDSFGRNLRSFDVENNEKFNVSCLFDDENRDGQMRDFKNLLIENF